VVRDDLRHPERRLQPVADGEPMAHHPPERLRQAEREEDQRPEGEGLVVVIDDPVLDGAADGERHQRLREHPEDAEEHAADQRADLMAAHPDEKPHRRSRVGGAGIVEREADHWCPFR
jgi:hypothetical protein